MRYEELSIYFHHHCRIRLRSGKEVFGVIWNEMSDTERAIYFASYIEHKKHHSKKQKSRLPSESTEPFMLNSDDILGVVTLD